MAEETKYCLCCGEDVPWNRITRDGNEELTCIYCGFILGATPLPAKTAKCIITVDDVAFVNDLLKGMLINKGLADTVMTAARIVDTAEERIVRIDAGNPNFGLADRLIWKVADLAKLQGGHRYDV